LQKAKCKRRFTALSDSTAAVFQIHRADTIHWQHVEVGEAGPPQVHGAFGEYDREGP
jgi:hypothetical protein